MLAPDVRFEGFTATDWIRLVSLFRPRRPENPEQGPARPRGGIVAVHAGGKLRKLVHTHVGRLRLDDAQRDWPLPAETLASRHDASWALLLHTGALDTIMERFGARARRGDDLSTQTLTLLELAREELHAGRIELWPRRLRGLPIPSPGVVRSTLDSVCPPGKTIVIGLFEAGELWTSIALRRGELGFDLLLGPDEVRVDMGLLAGDWRRDYRHLYHTVEERCGPVALGCYAEVGTLRKLLVDSTPGVWARAVAVRDVILNPVPAALTVPLGIDAGRAAFSALRSVAERLDPLGIAGPAMRAVLDSPLADPVITRVLGFNPLELLRRLVARDR
ncbi:MAG: hypothetical protein HUU21_09000 [Polyangiaceae bacterium]|nr:hypothetical protein [Polyangiaceae bacterium]